MLGLRFTSVRPELPSAGWYGPENPQDANNYGLVAQMVERPVEARYVPSSKLGRTTRGQRHVRCLRIWALGLHGVVACLASRKYRWVRFPQGPLLSWGPQGLGDLGYGPTGAEAETAIALQAIGQGFEPLYLH